MKPELAPNEAAIQIQRIAKGFFARKHINVYGPSQGKEIEIYLPLGTFNPALNKLSYDGIGSYKSLLCSSDLFNIYLDKMKFHDPARKKEFYLAIAEIVTAPYKKPGNYPTNLRYSESDIDEAVGTLMELLENFSTNAALQKNRSYFELKELIGAYNALYPQHPLSIAREVLDYIRYPTRDSHLFDYDNIEAVFQDEILQQHRNCEICFIYDKNFIPAFDKNDTPRTADAAEVMKNNDYLKGKLIAHVQKTFSLPVTHYTPQKLSGNPDFHNTPQQMEYLNDAYQWAQKLIEECPLPWGTNKARVLGLLTMCAERMITVIRAKSYTRLHEKADRPILSSRHLLHYIKLNVCNERELWWFSDMYTNNFQKIQEIFCLSKYKGDYRSYCSDYSEDKDEGKKDRYDAFFDLFGDFTNKRKRGEEGYSYQHKLGSRYGIKSWPQVYNNFSSLSGRTLFRLQKVVTPQNEREYHPLFEARRIGVFTVPEFRAGESQVNLLCSEHNEQEDIKNSLASQM